MQKKLNGCRLGELFGATLLTWCIDPFLAKSGDGCVFWDVYMMSRKS